MKNSPTMRIGTARVGFPNIVDEQFPKARRSAPAACTITGTCFEERIRLEFDACMFLYLFFDQALGEVFEKVDSKSTCC